MRRWLENYEYKRTRHSKSKEPNPNWVSSKYPIESMHWKEAQQIYLPEVRMNFGQAISAVKRSFQAYRIAGSRGEPRGDIAYRINRLQSAMGLEKSQFPELDGMDDSEEESERDQELTYEEIQAKKEEEAEESGGSGEWGSNLDGTNEEVSELDIQLLKEEKEAEDDWWVS
jgi:hypothetical protein